MELSLDMVERILEGPRGEDFKFRLVSNQIYDVGDHGEAIHELIVEHVGDGGGFWRTYYRTHHSIDVNDGELLTFVPVFPVAHAAIRWENAT